MSRTIFMSHALDEETPSYGNRDKLVISSKSEIVDGNGANTSSLLFTNNHLGTHFDAPYHFCSEGKKTLDYTAKDFLFDKIGVVKCSCDKAKLIKRNDLDLSSVPMDMDFLFVNTGYERHRGQPKYHNDNPGLDESLANDLRTEFPSIRAIGFDFISLTSWKFRDEGKAGHRAFLCGAHPILVIEDVTFSDYKDEAITSLVVAPLRTVDGNGGPVTIIANLKSKG